MILIRCPQCDNLDYENSECGTCGYRPACVRCGAPVSPADHDPDHPGVCNVVCAAAANEESWAELSLDR